ncbi:fibronectin type III domain-containing protein [Mangrovihabitans endophyticus]|uniref:Fibronectin type-III domain-containing protein n=1 Tax=Mangrovihabitans endophyticus TaxID=1751298 RepID=A0A8J3BZD2_9ACTN|nr:fibronectin type III domain-containing protein [Mangrovihabitans endophyticus]GGK84249.1 hypothetical protein GCM10012284_18060 [Mangrovihabitans endophyticus]
MRHVAPPIAELTARAQTLSSAGDLQAAREILTGALDPRRVDPQHASPDLATAAALLARILVGLGDSHAARSWAGFAHAAEDRLHGPQDERTLAAAALHAAVLHRVGNHGRAAQLYHDLVGSLATKDGPNSPRVLAAEADLATAEHAAGHCTAARARLADAWQRYRSVHGDAAPAGIKMLARLGAMERECGRFAESTEHLSLVQELCARYLPADHPLARQAASLAAAPPSGRHTCGRVMQSSGPDTDPGPAAGPVPAPAGPRHPERAVPDQAASPQAGPDFSDPPPDDRITDPNGSVYQAPMYLHQMQTAPGTRNGGRHARVDTPLPAPGQRAEYTRDGRRVPAGSAPVETPQRRLPVPVRRPERRPGNPYVLIAAVVAGIAVAAVVVVLTLPRAVGQSGAPATTPASSAPASPPVVITPTSGAPDGAAPTAVKLRDNHDSVSLTWGYPDDSEGPVLISGGRVGQEQRAFQQLPAGTTNYVVYGLNEAENYCFTVAVVYTTDRVATSKQVCTHR